MALLNYVGLESASACGGMLLNYAAPVGVVVAPQVEKLPTLGAAAVAVSAVNALLSRPMHARAGSRAVFRGG